jgi:hypothetical protein
MVQFRLRGWLHGRALAGLRDEAALANLPPEEAAEWRELWAEIGARHEYLRILNADR